MIKNIQYKGRNIKVLWEKPKDCLPGSLASVVLARGKGVNIFRVHDVPETLQALKITDAIVSADC